MEKKMITKDTLIAEIIELNPNAEEILHRYGMHCLGCALAHQETLEQAVFAHAQSLNNFLTNSTHKKLHCII